MIYCSAETIQTMPVILVNASFLNYSLHPGNPAVSFGNEKITMTYQLMVIPRHDYKL